MTKILYAKPLYDQMTEVIGEKIKKHNLKPILSTIRFGETKADKAYEKGIQKTAEILGIGLDRNIFETDIDQSKVLERINEINKNPKIGGLLIFRPIPINLDEEIINSNIKKEKDLDCMNPLNKSSIYSGEINGKIPLATRASVKLLEYYGYDFKGENAVIINRSNVIGKPLAMMLLNRDATITICHSKTLDLKEHTRRAKFIFTAMGKPGILDKSYFNKDAVVADFGVSIDSFGKISGDLADDAKDYINAYTPPKGGIGKLTNLMLLDETVDFYLDKENYGLKK